MAAAKKPAAGKKAAPTPKPKPKTTKAAATKAAAKKPPRSKPAKRPPLKATKVRGKDVVLLTGGNPQIAKGDGDAPVQAYIAALPGWKHALAKKLDALIVRAVPNLTKGVKWNSPFYSTPENGVFLGMHAMTRYLKLAFIKGQLLSPKPPGESKDPGMRYLDIHEDDELDEKQLVAWVTQAAKNPGWHIKKPRS